MSSIYFLDLFALQNHMEQSNISDLNINDEVDMEFNLEEAGENAIDLSLCLEGRFLTNIHIRVPIMKERMVEVWKPICGITIDELKPPVFLFCFYHIVDIQNVLKGGPWNFDKDVLIFCAKKKWRKPKGVAWGTQRFCWGTQQLG